MGSPVSVTVADLVMEDVEERALSTYDSQALSTVLYFGKDYVDDISTAIQEVSIQEFKKVKALPLTILCFSIKSENFMSAMATIAACIMGASYMAILSFSSCCGVSISTGPPGLCKSEATKCAPSTLQGAETHSFNSQTTLFSAAS